MKLTVVTAVFNAIKSGNRENLIHCVRSVAALKTPHEHLIYDGGSTDGTVELLRELEKKIGVENRCTKEGCLGVVGRCGCTADGMREITSGWFDLVNPAAIEGMKCISVPGEENPPMDRRAIKDIFQSFGVVENDADGRRVIFPAKSAGKMLGQSGIDIRRYVRSFADMFRRSRRAWSEKEAVIESHKQHRNITAYHQYIVKADLAGAICYVRFTVREDAGGKVKRNEIHSSTISRVTVYKAKGAELSGLGHAQVENSAPFVDNKIAFFLKGVKGGGALRERALPEINNSTTSHFSFLTSHSTLRVVSEPDTGIYNALNKGVRDAQGEWFYVLGCDDEIVEPRALESALDLGERTHSEAVASPVWTNKDLHSILPVQRNRFLCGTPYPHQGVLMRTNCLRAMNGFDETYRIAADYELMLRLYWCRNVVPLKIVFSKSIFAFYSIHGASSNSRKCFLEFERAIASVLKISSREARNVRLKIPKSLTLVLRCLTHCSREMRIAGCFLLIRYLVGRLGLLEPNGALRWH